MKTKFQKFFIKILLLFFRVDELNRQSKYWKDLLTNQPFTHKDILVIQDPKNIEKRTILNFDYIKNNKAFSPV